MDLEEQYDKIYRYCYFRLHNQWLAEDITQETFLRFLGSGTYQEQGRPLAWLYTVARNLCMDERRKVETEPLPEFLPVEDPTDELIDSIALRKALQRLDDGERELIFLRYVNEVPMADLAAAYGRSRYALYREIKAVLRKLRKEF